MFTLQAAASENDELAQGLRDAIGRVTAVARIHERLYRSADIATVDLAAYLQDICRDLATLSPLCEIQYDAASPIPISTDRAVTVALLATELVTNAARHAYKEGSGGQIRVTGRSGPDRIGDNHFIGARRWFGSPWQGLM